MIKKIFLVFLFLGFSLNAWSQAKKIPVYLPSMPERASNKIRIDYAKLQFYTYVKTKNISDLKLKEKLTEEFKINYYVQQCLIGNTENKKKGINSSSQFCSTLGIALSDYKTKYNVAYKVSTKKVNLPVVLDIKNKKFAVEGQTYSAETGAKIGGKIIDDSMTPAVPVLKCEWSNSDAAPVLPVSTYCPASPNICRGYVSCDNQKSELATCSSGRCGRDQASECINEKLSVSGSNEGLQKNCVWSAAQHPEYSRRVIHSPGCKADQSAICSRRVVCSKNGGAKYERLASCSASFCADESAKAATQCAAEKKGYFSIKPNETQKKESINIEPFTEPFIKNNDPVDFNF